MTKLARLALALVMTVAATSARAAEPTTGIHGARDHFEAGRYDAAVAALQSTVARSPQNADAWFWLGRARFELRDYAGAIDALKQAVDVNPADSEAQRWLGRAYGERADRERSFLLARRAREAFEEAVRIDSANLRARRDLMEFYAAAPRILGGGDEKAVRQVEAIAAIDPILGHVARAAYWSQKNESARAGAECRAALDARPKNADADFECADVFEKHEDAAGIRAAVKAAAAIDPTDPRLGYFRGVAGVLAADAPHDAETFLKAYVATVAARSDRPSPAAAHEWLGRLYELLNRPADATAEYRLALALEPSRRSARTCLKRLASQ